VLARDFADVAVDIEHHPVLLMLDCPPEGVNIVKALTKRYGEFDPAAMSARPVAEARTLGLDLDLRRQSLLFSTHPV
jgi:predicted DsbA family dithiol-disulfide isomerase